MSIVQSALLSPKVVAPFDARVQVTYECTYPLSVKLLESGVSASEQFQNELERAKKYPLQAMDAHKGTWCVSIAPVGESQASGAVSEQSTGGQLASLESNAMVSATCVRMRIRFDAVCELNPVYFQDGMTKDGICSAEKSAIEADPFFVMETHVGTWTVKSELL